jgi:diketogulonate reductase-like aldo/keto reductase
MPAPREAVGRSGLRMPVLGQGTWRMGEAPRARADELAALRLGLDLGLGLIDTAEMYGSGEAERIVGEAIAGRRDEVFLVSKVLPDNASRRGTVRAAERSLERLGVERLDLYLLHWSGRHPLEETCEAFERLVEQGKIAHYGVSNFDEDELERTEAIPAGRGVVANQVLYGLLRRAAERRVLPWCRARGVVLMAYSPLEQGRLREDRALRAVAARLGCTPYQVALAWTIREPGVVTIPKATRPEHVRQNAAAAALRLEADDLALLDAAFPPPERDLPLETL